MKRSIKNSGSDTTIADVAATAGVSIRTVSRVINRSTKVNAETRKRVEEAVENLKFRPSLRARALATGRSFLIGMIHNDKNALVLDAVQRGIVSEASKAGYELIMHSAPANADDAIADVIEFVQRSRVDGVLVLPPVSGIEGLADALAVEGIPAAAMSSIPVEGYVAITISEERKAAADVARFLIGLGHKKIAMITGPQDVISARERRAGFLEALSEAGIKLLAEAEGDYGFQSGLHAAEKFLDRKRRPTAIFASNDIMASGVVKAAFARRIAIPDELSVVGFDGSILAEMLTPQLTSVFRPFDEMARQATQQLLNALADKPIEPSEPARLVLLEGESSAPPPPKTTRSTS